jgi:hypothetical protein
VLRCFPFRRFDVRAVLIETNRVGDLRPLLRFFHRHGYAAVESFANGLTRRVGRQDGGAEIIDHLFVYQGERRYPPLANSEAVSTCPDERMHRFNRPWCSGWHAWEMRGADAAWTECRAPA